MKKIITVLSFVIVIAMLSGCAMLKSKTSAKTFSKAGMTIELTEAFNEREVRSYTAVYESNDVAVFCLKEEFSLLEGLSEKTIREYGEMVTKNNGKDAEIVEKDGLTYFIYENVANGKNLKFIAFLYKSADAFWMIQFSSVADKYDDYKDDFVKWAKTVKI